MLVNQFVFITLIAFVFSSSYRTLLLSLTNRELFNAALNKLTGSCVIVDARNNPNVVCDFYAQITGTTTYGLPDKIGTGCVVAPTQPKHINICWGYPNTYPTYNVTTTKICTGNYITNAANMIRIGIQRGYCNLPCDCPQSDYLASLSDIDLFNAAGNRTVGNCVINAGSSSSACDLYAIIAAPNTSSVGLPDKIGTGCVVAPSLPKHMSICWGPPNTYPSYNSTSTPICTPNYTKNAANMIRIGLSKNYCGIPCICPLKYSLLLLSDLDLFTAALNRNAGKCVIVNAISNNNAACDYYAQILGAPSGSGGLPNAYGTGCVVAPTLPKHMSICWAPSYPSYNNTSTPICTNDYIKNAANMIRIGLVNNLCGIC